jgi:hypothetical protein
MISPRQSFEDNIRPAELLLSVYRLLESKQIETQGDMVDKLRDLVGAHKHEDLMLIYNQIFIGLVRQGAKIPPADLKKGALGNLLRQAVVAACTALETYLPALLRENLPVVIEVKGRDFFPQDKELQTYFKTLTLTLSEVMRLLEDPDAPLYLANKVVGFVDFKYLSGTKGMHVVGSLLGITDPWTQIATSLHRNQDEMMGIIEETVRRRNDIVHRADRLQKDPGGEAQTIGFAWTMQAVDTISHVCLALDELVEKKVSELRVHVAPPQSSVVA